jgi:hypothetical protein
MYQNGERAMKPKQTIKLKQDPRNARRHPPKNKKLIKQSLEEVGGFRSIAVDGDNVIRAGNATYQEAQTLGLKIKVVDAKPDELVAVRRKDLKGKKAIRAALLDNLASDTSEFDESVIQAFAEQNPELLEGLLEYPELNDLLASQPEAPTEFQEYDENLETEFKCPKCGYEWSGKPT